jgi:hypothetical protein
MIEGGKGMGLSTAKLGYQSHNRSSIHSISCQSAQGHGTVFFQSACETGAGKEGLRVLVVFRSSAVYNLLQMYGKFIRIE